MTLLRLLVTLYEALKVILVEYIRFTSRSGWRSPQERP